MLVVVVLVEDKVDGLYFCMHNQAHTNRVVSPRGLMMGQF